MKTYVIKITLRGVSPMVWRRIRLPGTTSLATLHDIIQVVFKWDDEYLHQFHIYGKDYGIWYDGGLAFADDAYKVYLDDFGFDEGDKFTYEYNFFQRYLHDIRIERIVEADDSPAKPIFCISGSGMPGATKYDEYVVQNKLLKTIVRIPNAAPAEEQPIMDRLRTLFEKLDKVKFNRKKSNLNLAEIGL